MTVELLVSYVAGGIFSLLQELLDKFLPWHENLSAGKKRLIAVGLSIVASLAVFGLSCGNVLEPIFPGLGVTCDENGAILLASLIVGSLVGNQTTHLVAKRG